MSDSHNDRDALVGNAFSALGTSTGATGAADPNMDYVASSAPGRVPDNALMPDVDPAHLRAVFFDLDGTLLPMDLDEFLGAYFKGIGEFVARHGLDAQAFSEGFAQGMKAMAHHGPDQTNCEAYWDEFFRHADASEADWTGVLMEYYETVFPQIGQAVTPNPACARAVEAFRAKGYPVVLATMPYFPPLAVSKRLAWTGVPENAFARLTHYENSCAAKPSTYYYAENLAACGLAGNEVLMVGNNTVEDLSFADLGATVYLATDWLLNPNGMDVAPVPHGTMEQLADWAQALPPCTRPAADIRTGRIPRAESERALAANLHAPQGCKADAATTSSKERG